MVVARAEAERGRAEAERRLKDAEAERQLVARLADVRVGGIDRNDLEWVDREYTAAFRDFGMDLDALYPENAGGALAGRPATAEIVAALDAWAANRVQWVDFKDPFSKRLIELARAADPDPWRGRLYVG